MFSGNKPVLIMPAILMVVMIIGGYQFLQGNETISNEQLQEYVVLDSEVIQTEEGLRITANWDYTILPSEGLFGEDYLGIAMLDNSGEARLDVAYEEPKLELLHADQVIAEETGAVVSNGVIFSFANELVENRSYGNQGRVEVMAKGEQLDPEDVLIVLLHTWTNHVPLEKVDATLVSPNFPGAANVPHWIKVFE